MRGGKNILGLQLGLFGLLICVFGIFDYWRGGFDFQNLRYLLIGLGLMVSGGFILPHKNVKIFDKRDWLVAGLVLLIFSPLYLFDVQNIPRQINTDEVVIMNVSEDIAAQSDADLFGPNTYFDFPLLVFWVFGKLAAALGGMGVENMRYLHATSGVLIVLFSYFLFRLFLSRPLSILATTVIGFNHSLFFISRMAMRDNTALLIEIVALLFLVYGWRQRHFGWSVLGGVIAGLGFYTYYPSRITIFIWVTFVALFLLLHRFRNWRYAMLIGLATMIGFIITILPLFIANAKTETKEEHFREQILLTDEGRELQKTWVSAPDETSAVKTNIIQGLLTFNRPYSDEGNIYPHPGFSFVDVVTGILIWVGVVTIIFESINKRRISDADLLMLGGFLLIWLSLAFIINKAPNYTRLLIVLPFVGYMAARAVSGIQIIARQLFGARFNFINTPSLSALLIAVVFLANFWIAKDFVNRGNLYGDAFGDTIRFQEKHSNEKATWYFAPSDPTSYIRWGSTQDWQYWLDFAAGPNQAVHIISPNGQDSFSIQLPRDYSGYLLTNIPNWSKLIVNYETLAKNDLTPDSRIKAIKFVNQ